MEKIAINGKIYTILSLEELSFSDTVRGRLTKAAEGQDFQDRQMTAINVAYDYGRTAVAIMDSPLGDVIEYMEEVGVKEIVNFEVPLAIREARENEVQDIEDIIASIKARRRSLGSNTP